MVRRLKRKHLMGIDMFIRVQHLNTDETPVDLDSVSRAHVFFVEIMSSYDNATILSVLVTEEFNGNVLTTTGLR